jgi:hypothetical protein
MAASPHAEAAASRRKTQGRANAVAGPRYRRSLHANR